MPHTLTDAPATYDVTMQLTRSCTCCHKVLARNWFDTNKDGHIYRRCRDCRSQWGDNGTIGTPKHPYDLGPVIATTDDLTVLAECWNDCVEAGPSAMRRAVLRLEELLRTHHDRVIVNKLSVGIAELRQTGSPSLLSHWLGECRVPWRKVS